MRKTVLLFVLVTLTITGFGQKLVNAPYARFGPGLLENRGAFRTRSMGGAGIALGSPLSINLLNPASFAAIDTNSFLFDFGFDYQMNLLKVPGSSHLSDDMNFHHILLAIPLSKRVGFAGGVVPYSSGYYNITTIVSEGDPGYDPVIGQTENRHRGTGSYNEFFWGLGITPFKGLSVGGRMSFLFGELSRENIFFFVEDNNFYNNIRKEKINIRGFNFDYGIQYKTDLKNDLFASIGASFQFEKDYSVDYENLFSKYTTFSGSQLSADTLTYISDNNASATLPLTMGFGIGFGKKDKFTLAADFSMSKWGTVSFLGYESNLVDSKTISLGGEFIPDRFANYNYLNRVEYRFGGHLTDSYIMVNGEQLKEIGITFGVGLPLNRTKSRINLQMQYTRRGGSYESGLHIENCFNFGLSFNFFDYWFIKRKYN